MTVLVDSKRRVWSIMNPGDLGRARLRPTRKVLDMLSMLATGWLPWGVAWNHFARDGGSMPLDGAQFIMCCGHTLSKRRGYELVEAGLCAIAQKPDHLGRPCLIITDLGRNWLAWNWSAPRRKART